MGVTCKMARVEELCSMTAEAPVFGTILWKPDCRDAAAARGSAALSWSNIVAVLSDDASHAAMLALLHPANGLHVRAAAAAALRLGLEACAGSTGGRKQSALPLPVVEVRLCLACLRVLVWPAVSASELGAGCQSLRCLVVLLSTAHA